MTGANSSDSLRQKTVILRAPTVRATRDPFDGPGASPFEAAEAAANVRVEVDDSVDRDGLRTILKDPTVLGFAPAMPMKLIEPLEQSPDFVAEAGPSTWGVAAVGAPNSPFTGAGVTVA